MNRKLLFLILLIAGWWNSASADHLSSSLLFTARMNGDNEVPAVTSDGQGLGIFTFDEKKSTLYVNVSLSNLSGPLTGIHIHEGFIGENGGVIINLTTFLQGSRVKGSVPNFTRDMMERLIRGGFYVNAHTEMNPGGEIRGQIELETDYRFSAQLDGDSEVPSVNTDGLGLFVANLSHDQNTVNFHMVFQGLSSDVILAHIHIGAVGVSGPPVFDLAPFINGNVISGTWIPGIDLQALLSGELYINVHTVNNPGGEIRGQLVLQEGITFDAVLSGDDESPSVDTKGRGVAIVTVKPDLSEMEYYVVFDSLSGPAESAHFHVGVVGANGPVLIDLTDDIEGNTISGSAAINIDFLNVMLSGGIYLNIHTEAHQAGEIRGQVFKLAREAYTFELNGGQEVPPVSTTAAGSGIVSIDRNQSNAHFMIVYSGLQGNFTASHFHNGAPGQNGPVIFDLTGFFNGFGGAYGYWDQNSTPAFDPSMSLLFRSNQMYANVHSTMFMAGEIRGNVLRSRDLFTDLPFDPKFSADFMLAADMNGDNENPPVATNAVGLATFFFNGDKTSVDVNVTVDGLSGPITGAHIHDGNAGLNGPVIFPLAPEGNRIQTTLTGLTTEQLGKLVNGNYYINVHTAANPGGEIRGQIFSEQDLTFLAVMDGSQENPAVTTDARGLGSFHYTLGQLTLDVNVQFTGLSSPITGAHLHSAAPGVNGPVIIDLAPIRTGNTIRGTVNLTLDNLIALANNNVYVNVHTEDNPAGEIRGQLFFQGGLLFDGWMSGLQEVPFATTAASALAVANVSTDLENIEVWMVSDGASGTVGASHFHRGSLGNNGGVVLDLSSGLNNNSIHFQDTVSDQIVSGLFSGEIYINAHTAAFPAGEFRGQMFRLARDGYGYDACAAQETGAVAAPNAHGSGLVSVDRLHSNLNIAVVTTGLTGPITISHYHEAPIGTNGPVVVDLTPLYSNGAFNLIGATTDTAVVNFLRSGNAYLNVHTAMHPAGEIRGQVVKEFLCSIETALNELDEIVDEVMIHPVPVLDQLNVNIETHLNTALSMNVFDLSGKLMSSDQFNLTQGKNKVQVETSKLNPGFYILMITDGNAAQAYKFVK